jgi:hypothetical protein
MTPPLTILGDVFRGVYRQTRPRRLAIVGCGADRAIELVDPAGDAQRDDDPPVPRRPGEPVEPGRYVAGERGSR